MSLESIKINEVNDKIELSFKFLDLIIKSKTEEGLYDINKKSEDLIAGLMSELFDYGIINTYIDKRQPSVDLYNKNENILIQVTTTQTKAKLDKTINKAPNYYKDMKKLLFFILTMNYENRNKSWDWPGITFFDFSKNKEYILDFSIIIEKIKNKFSSGDISSLIDFGIHLCGVFDIINPDYKFSQSFQKELAEKKQIYRNTWDETNNNIFITPSL